LVLDIIIAMFAAKIRMVQIIINMIHCFFILLYQLMFVFVTSVCARDCSG